MKTIINFINEKLALNKQSKIAELSPKEILKKNYKLLITNLPEIFLNKGKKPKIEYISPKNADREMRKFKGMGSPSLFPMKSDDYNKIVDLISKYGGWKIDFIPRSSYVYDYHRGIVILTDRYHATMLIVKNGHWTMSGEDYVSGNSKIIDDIELK